MRRFLCILGVAAPEAHMCAEGGGNCPPPANFPSWAPTRAHLCPEATICFSNLDISPFFSFLVNAYVAWVFDFEGNLRHTFEPVSNKFAMPCGMIKKRSGKTVKINLVNVASEIPDPGLTKFTIPNPIETAITVVVT